MITVALLLAIAVQEPAPVTLRKTWSRGDDADTLVSFTRITPFMIAVGPDDRVYILDPSRHHVVVLDGNGKTLKPLGRQGNGPGELAHPVSMAVTPSGNVLVWDFARQGFIGWSRTRAVLPVLPFARPGIPANIVSVSDTVLYFTTNVQDTTRLIRYTPNGWTVVETVARAPALLVGKGLCELDEYRLPPVFSPFPAWTLWGADVVGSMGTEYQLRLGTGPQPPLLKSPVKQRVATRQMAITHLGPERMVASGRPTCKVPAERIIDAVGMASHLPSYERLIPVSTTILWALRYTPKGEAAVADIYDRKTGYRGSVQLGAIRPVAFLHDGRLLSVETNEDDVPLVVAYTATNTPRP